MNRKSPFDVFLSSSLRDSGLAGLIVDAFKERGINVFHVDDLRPGVSIVKEIREKLVECSTVVILATPASIGTQNLAFEAGMAMAWSKPIFVLYDGVYPEDVPNFLQKFRVSPVSEIGDIADVIVKSRDQLSEAELETLGRIYVEHAIPADRLLLQPVELSELTQEFARFTGRDLGGERIARELIRLRKSGKLPKIKPVTNPA